MFTPAASVVLLALLSSVTGLPAPQAAATTAAKTSTDTKEWQKSETITPETMMNEWQYFDGDDPTEGFVDYVNRETALKNSYVQVNSDGRLRTSVDITNKVAADARGRQSVRLISTNAYGGVDNDVLMVFDVQHIPTGYGTWPALWLLGTGGASTGTYNRDTDPGGWPNRGELDIVENWGNSTTNIINMHTNWGTKADGQLSSALCGLKKDHILDNKSFGQPMNDAKGGQYVVERIWNGPDKGVINVFFIPRKDVGDFSWGDTVGADRDMLTTWDSYYRIATYKTDSTCDLNAHFFEQQIILNITFCGGYGDNGISGYKGDGPGREAACIAGVRDYPESYTDAFWEIGNILIYTPDGTAATPPPPNTKAPRPT